MIFISCRIRNAGRLSRRMFCTDFKSTAGGTTSDDRKAKGDDPQTIKLKILNSSLEHAK